MERKEFLQNQILQQKGEIELLISNIKAVQKEEIKDFIITKERRLSRLLGSSIEVFFKNAQIYCVKDNSNYKEIKDFKEELIDEIQKIIQNINKKTKIVLHDEPIKRTTHTRIRTSNCNDMKTIENIDNEYKLREEEKLKIYTLLKDSYNNYLCSWKRLCLD